MFSLFKKKTSRQTKKQLKSLNKKKKRAAKVKKKVLTTIDWCDIKEVRNEEILLKDGSHVIGVKVSPHDIFLDDEVTKSIYIDNLRMVLNQMPFKIYWAFVASYLNIDQYKERLYGQEL